MHDIDSALVRLYEESAEELGRLDALVSVAPAAVSTALQLAAIARLTTHDVAADVSDASQATRSALASLASARVDLLHAAALGPALDTWRERVEDGERRARSGASLTAPSVTSRTAPSATTIVTPSAAARTAPSATTTVTPSAATAAWSEETARRKLTDALRPGTEPRPLLWRALEVVAWTSDAAEADLLAALLLVAGGLADRLHLLPFVGVRGVLRHEACARWREGEPTALTRAALSALSAEARHLRVQLRLLLDAQVDEDAHLASVGRAAVTGRRALTLLRSTLATSVPDLSERLSLSRPAAGAALERLVELGLAEEITGRARDRVFVYAGAWGLV